MSIRPAIRDRLSTNGKGNSDSRLKIACGLLAHDAARELLLEQAAVQMACYKRSLWEFIMGMLEIVLLIILLLLVMGAVPAWPHSRSWGYGPSGGLLAILLIILLLIVIF